MRSERRSPRSAAGAAAGAGRGGVQGAGDLSRRLHAVDVYRRAVPIGGTGAEAYLLGLAIDRADIPPWLRFDAYASHPATSALLPALVCPVFDVNAAQIGAWRIYLRRAPACHDWHLALVEPSRAALGICKGGAVRLSEASDTLLVCASVESGLRLRGHLRLAGVVATVWAALTPAGIAGVGIPERYGRVLLLDDQPAALTRAGELVAAGVRARAVSFEAHRPEAALAALDAMPDGALLIDQGIPPL